MKNDLKVEIVLGNGTTAQREGKMIIIKGPKGEVSREFIHPKVTIAVDKEKIVLSAQKGTKREKTIINSYEAHLKNMVRGVKELYVYKLKVCSGHFPITATVSGQEFVVKNFLGEIVPRKFVIPAGAEIKVSGAEVTVQSCNKEIAGMVAAKIEGICRITNRDLRIFQDGCY